MHFAPVLDHASQPGLLKAELSLDHPKWVLHLGADVSFGCFDQIIQSSLRRIWQHSPLSWSHGNAEANSATLHLGSLLNSLVAGIGVHHRLLTVEEISGWGEVVDMGSGGFH